MYIWGQHSINRHYLSCQQQLVIGGGYKGNTEDVAYTIAIPIRQSVEFEIELLGQFF